MPYAHGSFVVVVVLSIVSSIRYSYLSKGRNEMTGEIGKRMSFPQQ